MNNPDEDKTDKEIKVDNKDQEAQAVGVKIAEDSENTRAVSDDEKIENQPSKTAINTEESKNEDTTKQEKEEEKEEEEGGDGEKKITKEDCLQLLRKSFDGYDYNGNGTVAHEEVIEAYTLCQEEWKQKVDHERCDLEATIFMKDIDKGGDGQVDFEEYVKYFRFLWLLSQGYDVSN